MGTDKTQLQWQGQRLLTAQFNKMAELLGRERVIVSGNHEGFPCVPDEVQGLGPIEGFRSAVNHIVSRYPNSGYVLVVPVDMPLLSHQELRRIIFCRDKGSVVRFRNFELPAVFKLSSELIANLNEISISSTRKQDRSFRNLFSRLGLFEVEYENSVNFINTNTKEDWHEALFQADVTSTNRV